MSFQVDAATTPKARQQCMQVRKIVFCDEQGYPPSVEETLENKAHDEASSHFVATSHTGEAVGTVRIHNSTGQLGRLAVLPPFRGTGLARALCEAAHATAKANGMREVTADSQAQEPRDARGFYRKLGYVEKGDVMKKEGGYGFEVVTKAGAE